MRYVILGGPGSGKSTQAQILSVKLQIPLLSIRDVLKNAIAEQTPLGLIAEPYLNRGELVPDEMMIQFMRERLLAPQGWILEGYPRTAFQAEELDFLLDEIEQKLERAIYLQISEEMMQERSLNRGLYDDTFEVIQRRIEQFHERTTLILDYYSSQKKLLTVDASAAVEAVSKRIFDQLPLGS